MNDEFTEDQESGEWHRKGEEPEDMGEEEEDEDVLGPVGQMV